MSNHLSFDDIKKDIKNRSICLGFMGIAHQGVVETIKQLGLGISDIGDIEVLKAQAMCFMMELAIKYPEVAHRVINAIVSDEDRDDVIEGISIQITELFDEIESPIGEEILNRVASERAFPNAGGKN